MPKVGLHRALCLISALEAENEFSLENLNVVKPVKVFSPALGCYWWLTISLLCDAVLYSYAFRGVYLMREIKQGCAIYHS